MRHVAIACALLIGCGSSHRPPAPPTIPGPAPAERWQRIVQDSHRASSRQAPLDGFVLGDVWGQWLGSPQAIEGMAWAVNMTRVGVETKALEPFIAGTATVESCLDSPAAFGAGCPVDGGAPLTTLEQLRVAQAVGVNVMLTVDSSCNSGGPYHGCPPRALTNRAGTLRVYRGLLGYMAAHFADTVTHVQVENEPCYRSFTPTQYLGFVRAVVPIIRAKLPAASIVVGSGGLNSQCGNAVADARLDVDVIGFHVAVPDASLTNAQVAALVRAEASYLTARYGSAYDVWCDECGIGGDHSVYTAAGQARLLAMARGCRAGGCDGFLFLTIGGLDEGPIVWDGYRFDFALYTKGRGESLTAQAIRAYSRQAGVWWAPGVIP